VISILKVPLERATYIEIILGYVVGTPLVMLILAIGSALLFHKPIPQDALPTILVLIFLPAIAFLVAAVLNRLETLGRSKRLAFLLLVPDVNLIFIIYLMFANPKPPSTSL